jgi:hypothetical protein
MSRPRPKFRIGDTVVSADLQKRPWVIKDMKYFHHKHVSEWMYVGRLKRAYQGSFDTADVESNMEKWK